jgi:hypothetical protein
MVGMSVMPPETYFASSEDDCSLTASATEEARW